MPARSYGIYLARFRFLDTNNYKIRPVIIVSPPKGRFKIVIVVPISSSGELEDADIHIKQWKSSGLAKPSIARLHRMTAIMGRNILEDIGELSNTDQNNLKKALRKLFNL